MNVFIFVLYGSSALMGYNGTVFAYGQTGTGKTFTKAFLYSIQYIKDI